ncbi:10279_t:CDS:1 [Gigaspora margarita]|uniref:10279_t:CDS:1 n=1 Tax=Gigaspora margarita TaxID=4874 RepID=A0ABN7VHF9_GIGMA|nr:10279_t:CDS:1 [Gigaspora margarita]
MVGINTCKTDCTDAEWIEYCNISQIHDNKTPSKWMKQIWECLTYFRKNNLLPNKSKIYFEARRLIRLLNSSSYASEIGIAICFSCDQLVYTGQKKKNIGNYNYIGIERHWKFLCTSNKYCGVSYDEYLLKVKKKSISGYNYDNEYALHRYGLWMQNAIKKTKRAREIGKKIQACTIIQHKLIEYYYRSNGLCASVLAQHYKLLWVVQEEMCQVNNV